MEKATKRDSEIKHLKEQARKERYMKATAQAAVTSHRYSEEAKFNILPRKGNDTLLHTYAKHALPNHTAFLKVLNTGKLYHPLLGVVLGDPSTSNIDLDLSITNGNLSDLIPTKNGGEGSAGRRRRKSQSKDSKDSKVTPVKNQEKHPTKPRPPKIKLPQAGEEKKPINSKDLKTSNEKIESIFKEMTQMDPPLTKIKTPRKDHDTEFIYPEVPKDKKAANEKHKSKNKASPPHKTKSPKKIAGTRLSADDPQSKSTEKPKVNKLNRRVSHIIGQMDLGAKKGSTSSSSSSDDGSSSDSSSGSSDSEDEPTPNKLNDTIDDAKPPDKPLINNNNNYIDKSDLTTTTTTKPNDPCSIVNDTNDTHFGLKFLLEESSAPRLTSINAMDENSDPLLEGKDIEQIIGICPYIGKAISPMSPLDVPPNLIDEIISCKDPSLNFVDVDLLGTTDTDLCKDELPNESLDKILTSDEIKQEEENTDSLILPKKASGTLYQKDSKKLNKTERRHSVKNKDATQTKKTDERNKQSLKSNETKDKSKSKNTRIEANQNPSIKVTSGSNGLASTTKVKTKAELKMPVPDQQIDSISNNNSKIVNGTEKRSRRTSRSGKTKRASTKGRGRKSSVSDAHEEDPPTSTSSSSATTTNLTTTSITTQKSSLKRPSPVFSAENEISAKKPTTEHEKSKLRPVSKTDNNTVSKIKTDIKSVDSTILPPPISLTNGLSPNLSKSNEVNTMLSDLNKLIDEPDEVSSLSIENIIGSHHVFQNEPSPGIRSIISPLKSPEHIKFDLPRKTTTTTEEPRKPSSTFLFEPTISESKIPPLQEPRKPSSTFLFEPTTSESKIPPLQEPRKPSSTFLFEPTTSESKMPPLQEPPIIVTPFTHTTDLGLNTSTDVNTMLTRTTNIDAPPFSQIATMLPSEFKPLNVNMLPGSPPVTENPRLPPVSSTDLENNHSFNINSNLEPENPIPVSLDNNISDGTVQTSNPVFSGGAIYNAPSLNFNTERPLIFSSAISSHLNIKNEPELSLTTVAQNQNTTSLNFTSSSNIPSNLQQLSFNIDGNPSNSVQLNLANEKPIELVDIPPFSEVVFPVNATLDPNMPMLNLTSTGPLLNTHDIPDEKPSYIPLDEKPPILLNSGNVTAEMPYVSPKEEIMEIPTDSEAPPDSPPILPPIFPTPSNQEAPPELKEEPSSQPEIKDDPLSQPEIKEEPSSQLEIKEEPSSQPETKESAEASVIPPSISAVPDIKQEDTQSPGNCFEMLNQFNDKLKNEKRERLVVKIPLSCIKLKQSTLTNYKNRTKGNDSPSIEDMEIDVLGDDSPLKRRLPASGHGVKKMARIESSDEDEVDGKDSEVKKNLNESLNNASDSSSKLLVRIDLSKLKRIPRNPGKSEPKSTIEEPLHRFERTISTDNPIKKGRGRPRKEKTVVTPTLNIKKEPETRKIETDTCSECGTHLKDNKRNPQRLACYKNTYATYMNTGRTNKHRADCLTDEIDKAHTYIEAVLNYVEYLIGLEQSAGKMSTSEGIGEFMRITSDSLKLAEYVVSNYGSKVDPILNMWDKRFMFLCLRLQSILNLKLYKMKRDSAKKNSKILSQYYKQYKVNSIVGRSPFTKPNQRGSTGTPSPSSPGPSPGGSVASVGSAGSTGSAGANEKTCPGLVTIPSDMHEKGYHFLQSTKYLINGHRLWDDSDSLQHSIQSFVQNLNKKTGDLTMQSTLVHIVDFVRIGIQMIQESRKT